MTRGRLRGLASQRSARHLVVVGAVAGLAALTYLPAFGFPPVIPPFNGDNVRSFHVAEHPDPAGFFTDPTEHLYRPLAYLSLWVQDQVHGLRPSLYFSVNIGLWLACVLCAYALVVRHTRSVVAGGAAALAMLVDGRATTALIWIVERQSTLVCLFGGLALLLAYRLPGAGARRPWALAALTSLLLAAALSKEYGLAFGAGVAVVALVTRPDQRRALLGAVALSVAAYSVLRWGVAGESGLGGSTGYCERMGYLREVGEVCYGELDLGTRLLHQGWNVAATLVATFLPPLFSDEGKLLAPGFLGGGSGEDESFAAVDLLFPAAVAGCAVVAWVKHPRVTLPLLAIVVANALLGFALFRPRNQLGGAFALYVSAGIGLVPALRMLEARVRTLVRTLGIGPSAYRVPASAVGVAVVAAGFTAGVLSRSAVISTDIEDEAADYGMRDPCSQVGEEPPIRRELAEALRRKFGLQPVECPPTVE